MIIHFNKVDTSSVTGMSQNLGHGHGQILDTRVRSFLVYIFINDEKPTEMKGLVQTFAPQKQNNESSFVNETEIM